MERQIITTHDGSKTIHIPELNEQYHSIHGAIQEARHVFIKQGLLYYFTNENEELISILEIGFGTGLNAFISLLEAEHNKLNIRYNGVEAYPVEQDELKHLNYVEQLQVIEFKQIFNEMHDCSWNENHRLTQRFLLKKELKLF